MHELENDSKRVTRDVRSVESATQILTTQERIAVIARYEAHRRWIGDDDDTACRGID